MRKWNKRLLSGCLLAALLLSMSGCQQGNTTSSAVSSQAVSAAAASSEETTEDPVETYHDMPVQTLDLDPSDPDYYQKALETELYNYKLIRNVPTAYQAESWDAYTATANTLLNIDPDNIDDVSKSMIDNAVAQREALVQDAPAADCMWYIWGDPHLRKTEWMDKGIDPTGLRIGMRKVYNRYRLPMIVTENGMAYSETLGPDGCIHDPYRIEYLKEHIEQIGIMIDEGLPVFGYCPWSFVDVVSSHQGFAKRYGLVYVDRTETDPKQCARVKKDSFYWYQKVITNNGLTE